MKKNIKLVLIVLVIFFLVGLTAIAKNEKSKANANSGKDKQEKSEKIKDFEKSTPGKSNSAIYKEKTDQVSADLAEIAETEKNKGQQKKEEKTERNQINNPDAGEQVNKRMKTEKEIAEELEEISEETGEVQDKTVKAIDKVEKQNKFKKLLVGTDYKNLGQLRSSLVHNRNQIRQLTRISEEVGDEESKQVVQSSLETLMGERERIKEVITENEEGFSLLGWVFRIVNGYPQDSIDEAQETELKNEVAEVLKDETENTENEMTDEEKTQQDAENNPQMPPVLEPEIVQ
jgi:hypothetical protein